MFDGFLTSVSVAWGTTISGAGIILSIICIAFFIAVLAIGSGSGEVVAPGAALGIIFFTAIEWFPVWTGAILAIVFGLLFAKTATGTILK